MAWGIVWGIWSHRISRHGATKVTPFELVYSQEVVLPVEVNMAAYRLAKKNELSAVDYHDSMLDNIDEVTDKRLQALKEIEKDKIWVARAYNKKVKLKSFQVGDLVWKTILPVGTKDHKFGKWTLSWEGLYTIVKVIIRNSYMLKALWGEHLPRALNRRYLKKYYPSVWQDAWVVKADVLLSSLGGMNGRCLVIDLSNFGTRVFLYASFTKNRWACVDK
jgi:hypothetical protein